MRLLFVAAALALAACGGDVCSDLKDRCNEICENDGGKRNCSAAAELATEAECEARIDLDEEQLCTVGEVL